MKENTCQHCEEKYIGCHDRCEKFLEASRKHEEEKALIRKNKEKASQVANFKIDSLMRARKKKGK